MRALASLQDDIIGYDDLLCNKISKAVDIVVDISEKTALN